VRSITNAHGSCHDHKNSLIPSVVLGLNVLTTRTHPFHPSIVPGLNVLTTRTHSLIPSIYPSTAPGLNVYDIRIPCEVPGLCYDFSGVEAFLTRPDVLEVRGGASTRVCVFLFSN